MFDLRYSKRDKRNFYIIARGSTFECVAILDACRYDALIEVEHYQLYYQKLEQLSKMLFTLISKLDK